MLLNDPLEFIVVRLCFCYCGLIRDCIDSITIWYNTNDIYERMWSIPVKNINSIYIVDSSKLQHNQFWIYVHLIFFGYLSSFRVYIFLAYAFRYNSTTIDFLQFTWFKMPTTLIVDPNTDFPSISSAIFSRICQCLLFKCNMMAGKTPFTTGTNRMKRKKKSFVNPKMLWKQANDGSV